MRKVRSITRVGPRIALFASLAVTAVACDTGDSPGARQEGTASQNQALTITLRADATTNVKSGVTMGACSEGGQDAEYISNGSYIQWNNVSVTTGGSYTVSTRNATTNTANTYAILVDGTQVVTNSFGSTGGWETFSTFTTASFNLSSGTHTVKILFTSAGENFEWLSLNLIAAADAGTDAAPDAAPDAGPDAAPDAGPDAAPDAGPDAAPDAGPDAAAEAGSGRSISSNLYANSNDGQNAITLETCSEGGQDAGFINNGSYIQWNISVPTGGLYVVNTRSASTATATYTILVDGAQVATNSISSTGGWQIWNTFGTSSFNLTSGTHTLKILFTSAQNLEYLSVAPYVAPGGTYSAPVVDRAQVQLNGTWKFTGSNSLTGAQVTSYNDSGWASVSVPHTWDSVNQVKGANRLADNSNAWYRTHFNVAAAGKRTFVNFEGAFQVADVYVNGTHLGQHRGGYTRFTYDATNAVNVGDNVVAVMVSNADCSDCLPDGNTRLFKGYGGIYRKAWVITTNKYQVSNTDYSSSGVYITPTNVSSGSSGLSIRTVLTNNDTVGQTFTVNNYLTDTSENIVLNLQQNVVVGAGSSTSITQAGTVTSPHLWSQNDPYLYNVHTTVTVNGTVTDAVDEHTGFRWVSLTSNDFTLNGVSHKLRGVAKHEETEYKANAVSDDDLITDWNNLQDLGVNYVRLPHYPHSALEYTLADQRGILVWAENGNTNSGGATGNGDYITREMVYQSFNHPSIAFWSAGNEVQSTNAVAAVGQYCGDIKAADPSRYAVYASNGQSPSGCNFIFQNTYMGWYGGSMYDWNTMGNTFVSESGAGMSLATQTADPWSTTYTVDQYEPEGYGDLVNEVKYQDMFVTNPGRVPAFSEWVFREFSDMKYKGYRNTKGLLTFANFKKDGYYLYQSFLKSSRVIHIVGKHYFLRTADADNDGDIKVYSNAPSVTLTVNGVNKGTVNNGSYYHRSNNLFINNAFFFENQLSMGRNDISVTDGSGNTDTATVYYKGTASSLPNETGAKVANLTSTNSVSPAFYIRTPLHDQFPFYRDWDSNSDNTFDVIPSALQGADGFIAIKRQSDSTRTTNLAFDVTASATVYIMFTNQGSVPSWITGAGFTDSGTTGQWRDNNMNLVNYQLYQKSVTGGTHISLGSSVVDYLVVVK